MRKVVDLKKIVAAYPECITNRKQLRAILLDTYTSYEERAQIKLLLLAYDAGFAQATSDEGANNIFAGRVKRRLVAEYSIEGIKAEWAVQQWISVYSVDTKKTDEAPYERGKDIDSGTCAGVEADGQNAQGNFGVAVRTAQQIKHKLHFKRRTAFLIAGVIFCVIAAMIIMPKFDELKAYNNANNLMKNGEYEAARIAFESLGTYRESIQKAEECKELQKEEKYQDALELLAQKDYEKAISQLRSLGDYSDSVERYKMAAYQYASQLLKDAKYTKAIEYFSEAKDYKDASDKKFEATYAYADQLLRGKAYSEAIRQFENCLSYKDSKNRILETKYKYVVEHEDRSDWLTYQYLQDLMSEGYADTEAIYEDMYKWVVRFYAVNESESDETTNLKSLSKYSTWCFHFALEGGAPGAMVQLYYRVTYPDGSTSKKEPFSGEWARDYTGTVSAWYDSPMYGVAGVCKVVVYDSTGNNIGSTSVRITE